MCSAITSSPRTRAAFRRVRMRRQDRERPLVDPRQHVADAHAAARDADDLVEVEAGLVDVERKPLDQRVVLVPAHVQAAHRRIPLRPGQSSSLLERVAQQDRLVAVRPGRDHRDRRAGQRLDPRRGTRARSPAARRTLRTPTVLSLQPGQRLVDRHAFGDGVGAGRHQRRRGLPSTRVARADPDLGHAVQHVELRDARPSTPFSSNERRSIGMSSQPQRRGRPVTEPNSLPRFASPAPTSSVSSVGNGPAADARRVRLDDAEHVVEKLRADAARRARRRPRGSSSYVTYG